MFEGAKSTPLISVNALTVHCFLLETKNRHLLRKTVQASNDFMLSFLFQVVSKVHTLSTKLN